MTRLMMITVAVLAFAGQAAAAEMPKDLQGSWCDHGDRATDVRIYRWTAESCDPTNSEEMRVGPRGFETGNVESCRLLKVSKQGPVYQMTFRCSGDEPTQIVKQRWQRERSRELGTLIVSPP